jgi:hypothetical protein
MKNKRGDVESIIFIVILLFAVAVAFFFLNHMKNEIFTHIRDEVNGTSFTEEAPETMEKLRLQDNAIWDYAFLGIFMGSLIAIGLTAYAVRISPVFYWIYALLSLIVLGMGVILSNIWQDLVANPEFTTTLTRFPITNMLLGSYYPVVVTAIILLAIILLFGKPPGREEGYY